MPDATIAFSPIKDVKLPGCCTLCNVPVFDIIAYSKALAPSGARIPMQLGPALATCRRVKYRLSNNALVPLVMCSECCDAGAIHDLNNVWEKCLRSHAHYSGSEHDDVAEMLKYILLEVVAITEWPTMAGQDHRKAAIQ